jgi:hypothetical protein
MGVIRKSGFLSVCDNEDDKKRNYYDKEQN